MSMTYKCNSCNGTHPGRYTGKIYAPPPLWWVGRSKPWPVYSPGEIHACTRACKEALQKDGHRGLVWNEISKGRIVARGKQGLYTKTVKFKKDERGEKEVNEKEVIDNTQDHDTEAGEHEDDFT